MRLLKKKAAADEPVLRMAAAKAAAWLAGSKARGAGGRELEDWLASLLSPDPAHPRRGQRGSRHHQPGDGTKILRSRPGWLLRTRTLAEVRLR